MQLNQSANGTQAMALTDKTNEQQMVLDSDTEQFESSHFQDNENSYMAHSNPRISDKTDKKEQAQTTESEPDAESSNGAENHYVNLQLQMQTMSQPDVEMPGTQNDDKNTQAELASHTGQTEAQTTSPDAQVFTNDQEEEKKSLQQNLENVVTQMQSKSIARGSKTTTIKDFTTLKVLGIGTYGKVLLVLHKETQKYYAMKVLKKKVIRKLNQVEHTKAERRILECVDHPFIVKMKYAFKDREKLYFVLNYCHGGELFFYITNLCRFKVEFACFYAANILLALKCLHEHNIIYRDLKPENVLIDADGYALLTDFGLSKENMTDGRNANSLCGTAEYLAPEILQKKRQYGKECDWWSFGVLLYEMITGQPPFYSTDRKELFAKIKNDELAWKKFHTPVIKDIISRLLNKDPNQRLCDPESIMKHKFFETINWDKMMKRQCLTPYKPQLTDPTDTSHFDKEQTSLPVSSPNSSPPSALGSILSKSPTKPSSQISEKHMLYEVESYEDEFGDFYFSQSSTPFGMLEETQNDNQIEGKIRSNSFEITNNDERNDTSPERRGSGQLTNKPSDKSFGNKYKM